jgi:uncharacterized protein (DUF934 family)
MAIVDRNGPIDDAWVKLADDAQVPAGLPVVVSLARLKNEHNALFATAPRVGVEIGGDVVLEDLLPFLGRLNLIVVRFAFMRDGRPFSIGRLMRERYRYQGDLRATGDYIPDQVLFLLRCGYSSFEVGAEFSIDSLKRSVAAYTAWYQRGVDRTPTVLDLRHAHGEREKPNGSTS